jgi:hypothetical protein
MGWRFLGDELYWDDAFLYVLNNHDPLPQVLGLTQGTRR